MSSIPTSAVSKSSGDDVLVSVVMPAYRTAAYIAEAIESVLNQTFTNYEIIVVNDGCPDTPALEQALAPYLDQIQYLKQENQGPAAARNNGIRHARGTFVAFLDSDDIWLPDYLSEQMNAFADDPTLDLHYVDARLFGNSHLDGKTHMEIWPSTGEVTFASLLSIKVAPVNVCTVARRAALQAVGMFSETFTRAEDLHLYARLAHQGFRFGYQNKVLARVRLRDESLTANWIELFKGQVAVYRDLATIDDLKADERKLLEEQLGRAEADMSLEWGKTHLRKGDYEAAAGALSVAQKYYHSRKLQAVLIALRSFPSLVRWAYTARDRYWTTARNSNAPASS
jgi:hypothetical protein